MASRYCEVALPVPLRSAFTYAIPSALDGECLVGRRLVVPFGRRAMVGVGIAESQLPPVAAPPPSQIKELVSAMDSIPALTPNLIVLGQWISRYYAAPIGETMRAMLPPEIELRRERQYA
ncbi:MAG: primosomal protein N', partial [Candidatus Acidiferrales bacterium]